jgi:hypothetical protein
MKREREKLKDNSLLGYKIEIKKTILKGINNET